MVILKIEFAAAVGALAAVSFEDCPADLSGYGLALALWPGLAAFIDVKHHVSPVQSLSVPALPVSDQGQHIPLGVAAGLPVEGVFEPPPDAGTRSGDGHGMFPLDGREVGVVSAVDPHWRTACPNEPDTAAEQETSIVMKAGVGILA